MPENQPTPPAVPEPTQEIWSVVDRIIAETYPGRRHVLIPSHGILRGNIAAALAAERERAEKAEGVVAELRRKLAEAGVEGSPPPWPTTIGTLQAQNASLAAEVEGLRGMSDEAKEIETLNAGAAGLAGQLLKDDGHGVMSPGPCADALIEWRRMKAAGGGAAADAGGRG